MAPKSPNGQKAPVAPVAEPVKAKRERRPADTRPVPVWRVDGIITDKKMKLGVQFPRNREGFAAYCDYKAALWTDKAAYYRAQADPLKRKMQKRDKLAKMLALLDAELAAAAAVKA